MKSTFIGTILFAFAIVNQVSAVEPQPDDDGTEYVDKATFDEYEDECNAQTLTTCANSPHCELVDGMQPAEARLIYVLNIYFWFLDFGKTTCEVKAKYAVGPPDEIPIQL